MAPSTETFLSPEEYLTWEEDQEEKHEYLNGRIYAMSGATGEHNRITFNLAALGPQLRGRSCEGFTTDMRLKVSPTGLYTYPDMTVVCGSADFDRRFKTATLLNPTLIIEVLSDATEAHDRGEKFAHYRRLESLRGYLMISTRSPRLEHYQRQEAGLWLLNAETDLDKLIALPEIACTLPLEEVYYRIDFPALPLLITPSDTME